MTIIQLKNMIEDLPDDMEVIIRKDAEGNAFSPLVDVDPNCFYMPKTTWSGDVYDASWSYNEAGVSREEWLLIKSNPKVVVLTPIN